MRKSAAAGVLAMMMLGFFAAVGQAVADTDVYRRLSASMRAEDRTRAVVARILDETNATFLTLWAYQEPEGVRDEMTITPDERRSQGWKDFYKNPESKIDHSALAASCIQNVYGKYFSDDELAALADFLEQPKTRADVRLFAQTPLGRKYRAVMRRLSSETLMFIQQEVDSVVQSVLGGEAVGQTQEILQ